MRAIKVLISVLSLVSATTAALAQGTIRFANFDADTGLDAPVFLSYPDVTPVSGPTFQAGLIAGSTAGNMVLITNITAPFLPGNQAGYFDGGVQSIPGIPEGNVAWVVVVAWNTDYGATFWAAQFTGMVNSWGQGNVISVVTGSSNSAPALPTSMSPFMLNWQMDLRPVIRQVRNAKTGAITLLFSETLQVSSDLVNWTNVVGSSPLTFPPNQSHQYFRAHRGY